MHMSLSVTKCKLVEGGHDNKGRKSERKNLHEH